MFILPVGLGKSKKLEEGESPDGRGVGGRLKRKCEHSKCPSTLGRNMRDDNFPSEETTDPKECSFE